MEPTLSFSRPKTCEKKEFRPSLPLTNLRTFVKTRKWHPYVIYVQNREFGLPYSEILNNF